VGGRVALWVLGAVVVGGAVLRFATLDHQSLWYDEALTWQLILMPLGDLIRAVVDTENTPPLFYAATHVSTKVAGTGEVGLRLVSALAGTLTIAVAFVAGRQLAGDRAGVCAAALVGANAMLVWFSQEARSYALLSLLSAIALVCFLRVIDDPRSGWALVGWVISSAAALATHYFAVFPMAAEAAWIAVLLARARLWRPLLGAIAATAVAVAAIAPIAATQEASGRAANILILTLGDRIVRVPKHFLVGFYGPAQVPLAVLSSVLIIVAAVGLWRVRRRRAVLAALTVAGAAVLVPMAAGVIGIDFLNSRNVLPALVPLLVLAGVGFAALPASVGITSAAALAAVGVVTTLGVNAVPGYQRTNWRGVDAAVGESPDRRLLVIAPLTAEIALRPYREGIALALPPKPVREVLLAVTALDSEADGRAVPPRPEPPALPGFRLVGRELDSSYTLYRYRAPRPMPVPPELIAKAQLAGPAIGLAIPPSG
jgi:mannosyltransferase